VKNQTFAHSPGNSRSGQEKRNEVQTPTLDRAAFKSTLRKLQKTISGTIRHPAIFSLMLIVSTFNARLNAQSGVKEFVPFRDFLENTKAAGFSDYATRPANHVKDARAFEEMRQHILTLYQGVEVTHSFVLDSNHFDCVPIEQQPAVRILGLKSIASPPPQPTLAQPSRVEHDTTEIAAKPASQLDSANSFDEFGNSATCEEHTIPMLRLTMERMTHFPTLRQFFQKVPQVFGRAAGSNATVNPAVAAAHKYSITYQYVNNLGGSSTLNIWSPYVNTSAGEIFSLSQEWYVGGSGVGLQTEEVGWVVYPAMFGDEKSHFFIYSTPDNYSTGCWNNTCGNFVQVANNGILGARFTNYSTLGGTQYEFSAKYYLYQGNWWLAYQGTWIGYYPGSLYHGGQNTKYAQLIEFGTESVGTTVWPPEGTGNWSSAGWSRAAYQRNLFYTSTSAVSVWDKLTAWSPSPACYSISGPSSSSSPGWGVYFYEGGPGGSGC
jgi:Neprosin